MKKCKDCHLEKEQSEFYGAQGECKECTKKRVRLREQKLMLDPSYVEKERKRHREKYKRLNYKDKQNEWDKNKPWKKLAIYKNLSRKFKTPKGYELHHWNYNTEFMEDVILMKTKSHRHLHRYLKLDIDKRIFKIDGCLELDTKEKHLKFIDSICLEYLEY